MIRKKGKRYEVRAYDPAVKRNVYVGMRSQRKPGNGVTPDPAIHATALEDHSEREFRRAFEGDEEAERARERRPPLSVGRDRWVEARRSPHAKRPWRGVTAKHNAERTVTVAADFEDRNPDAIERHEGQAWAQRNAARLPAVRAMVNWMRDNGLCDTNPFERSGIGKGPGRGDDVPLTEDDLANLVTSCDVLGTYADQFRGFIYWQSYVGCRPAEGLRIERARHIDLASGVVWIEGQKYRDGTTGVTKNGEDREVILPDPARPALELIPTRIDSPWLFHNKSGDPLLYAAMLTYWHKVCDASGLSRDARWLDADEKPCGIDPYHLRHFCGSHLADLGVDAKDIAIQLGHTDGGKLAQELYIHTYEDRALARLHEAYRSRKTTVPLKVHPRFRAAR
jgi:integrase